MGIRNVVLTNKSNYTYIQIYKHKHQAKVNALLNGKFSGSKPVLNIHSFILLNGYQTQISTMKAMRSHK